MTISQRKKTALYQAIRRAVVEARLELIRMGLSAVAGPLAKVDVRIAQLESQVFRAAVQALETPAPARRRKRRAVRA